MFYVFYNNFAQADVNDALVSFAKKLRRNSHKVVFQNPQGYRSNERVPGAETVVLVEGVVGDASKQIERDYKADKVTVRTVSVKNLETLLPRAPKSKSGDEAK